MKWTGLNEVREKYLSFFESKGHTRLPSAPLVPIGDNSLLLINSGMAPLKKYFLGQETPPNVRATSCQKCIRTPDIERVGKTARHGTYFEMLGNFSFGDYFKEDATTWAWEFCTEVLEMPVDKLYVSIYEEDDEAFDIWTKRRGVAPDHMVRLGLFKLASESSVAAGVRRIEAVTGRGVLPLIAEEKVLLSGTAAALKAANIGELVNRAHAVCDEIKALEKKASH